MLPAIVVELDLSGLDAACDALERAIDDELGLAMDEASRLLAGAARANHPFANRTGDLEASIRPLDTFGRFSDGTLSGGAAAWEDYAAYVDGNHAFLAPAFERMSPWITAVAARALARAARRAGWV